MIPLREYGSQAKALSPAVSAHSGSDPHAGSGNLSISILVLYSENLRGSQTQYFCVRYIGLTGFLLDPLHLFGQITG